MLEKDEAGTHSPGMSPGSTPFLLLATPIPSLCSLLLGLSPADWDAVLLLA